MNNLVFQCAELLNQVRQQQPVVHQLVNDMIMTDTANALLALGASPTAAQCREELEEMVDGADSLILNISNVSQSLIDTMQQALPMAGALKTPAVLDASGVGSSNFRRYTGLKLLEAGGVSVLRATPYEVLVLTGDAGTAGGPDVESRKVIPHARDLCVKYGLSCMIPGRLDQVVTRDHVVTIRNGVPMSLKLSTATSILSSLCAAFFGISQGAPLEKLVAACLAYRISGEIAAKTARGPGTFHGAFLDALHDLDARALTARAKISLY